VEVKAEAEVGRSTDVVSKPSKPNQVYPSFSLDEHHKGTGFYLIFEISALSCFSRDIISFVVI
jgi:hypothetical protein